MRLRVTTNHYFSAVSEFSFIKEIGVGSFGSVKLALHVQTNKCYAVKVVTPSLRRSILGQESARTKSCCLSEKSTCIQPSTTRISSSFGTPSSKRAKST